MGFRSSRFAMDPKLNLQDGKNVFFDPKEYHGNVHTISGDLDEASSWTTESSPFIIVVEKKKWWIEGCLHAVGHSNQ